jgi:prepilin peptidase CpaA
MSNYTFLNGAFLMGLTELLIPLWLLACALSDWRSRRVPNAYSFGFLFAAAASLLLQGQALSGTSWQSGLLGFAFAGLITLPGFVLNRLGGGDVKLLAGLGLATDPLTVVVTFVVGTLVLVIVALGQRLMVQRADTMRQAATPISPKVEPLSPEEELAKREWPFVPGLFIGYLVATFALPYYLAG